MNKFNLENLIEHFYTDVVRCQYTYQCRIRTANGWAEVRAYSINQKCLITSSRKHDEVFCFNLHTLSGCVDTILLHYLTLILQAFQRQVLNSNVEIAKYFVHRPGTVV